LELLELLFEQTDVLCLQWPGVLLFVEPGIEIGEAGVLADLMRDKGSFETLESLVGGIGVVWVAVGLVPGEKSACQSADAAGGHEEVVIPACVGRLAGGGIQMALVPLAQHFYQIL
jgi:hypothetical protein